MDIVWERSQTAGTGISMKRSQSKHVQSQVEPRASAEHPEWTSGAGERGGQLRLGGFYGSGEEPNPGWPSEDPMMRSTQTGILSRCGAFVDASRILGSPGSATPDDRWLAIGGKP